MTVDLAQSLRDGMRRLASGVSVLAVKDAELGRIAMTASSVTSVSDNPPSLLVCVNTRNTMATGMQRNLHFSVNVLSAAQCAVSNLCAGGAQGEERFLEGDWRADEETGVPYLDDAEAVFICQKEQVVRHGTHDIFIGNIKHVLTNSGPVNPLIYLNGGYHQL
jgi:flavin reductase